MSASNDFFADQLAAAPVLAVLRSIGPERAVRAADACWNAGVALVEVSRSHDPGLESLRAVCTRARELGKTAGAGTVSTVEHVHAAAAAGAAFAVAPGYARNAAATARAIGLPYLPGVTTPSEVQRALADGLRTLKIFPARELGVGWLASLRGPFPEARFVAVGGVGAENAAEFVAAGAIAVGIGSGLDPEALPALIERLRSIRRD